MSHLNKKIETATNIAIIFVIVVITAILIKDHVLRRPDNTREIAVGTRFALPNASWRISEKSIVFALSTTCHFCSESAGFYRELLKQCKLRNIRSIAVFPQEEAVARQYAQNLGVEFDEVRQAPLSMLEIYGTPTLLLVDNQGIVRNVWIGKLPDRAEREVFSRINHKNS
jgi:hypothetical protein